MSTMNLQTTIYIDKDVFDNISNYSKRLDMSKTDIIKYLLIKMNIYLKNKRKANTLIQYQRHCPENGFITFHYKLNIEENKIFKYMQHISCKSLSLLLFIAYVLFFGKLLKNKNSLFQKEKCVILNHKDTIFKNIFYIKNIYDVQFENT